jgi:prepilin-type N-terminal cleavage/methylation domain-containing protein
VGTDKVKRRRGFTLVEAVAASVILGLAVMMLAAASTHALLEARLNRQYETAAMLADKQLSMIDYIGIDSLIETGQMEGDFDEYEPVYHWQASAEYEGIDNLYTVTVAVSWVERNRPYSVTVETRFNARSIVPGTAF